MWLLRTFNLHLQVSLFNLQSRENKEYVKEIEKEKHLMGRFTKGTGWCRRSIHAWIWQCRSGHVAGPPTHKKDVGWAGHYNPLACIVLFHITHSLHKPKSPQHRSPHKFFFNYSLLYTIVCIEYDWIFHQIPY